MPDTMSIRRATVTPTLAATARAAAPEEEARVADMLQALGLGGDWYWTHDAQLRYTWQPLAGHAFAAPGTHVHDSCDLHALTPQTLTHGQYAELIAARQPFRDLPFACQCPDGSTQFLALSGCVRLNARGEYLGYHGLARDRTEDVRAQQLLHIEHQVTRQLAEVDGADDGLRAALQAVCTVEGWTCGEYWSVDRRLHALRFGGYWDGGDLRVREVFERSREFVFPPGVGLAGRVWESREPMWVADVTTDARMLRKDLAREAGLHGAFLFPTFAGGDVVGVFSFWSQRLRKPDERLMQSIAAIGNQIGQFLRRKDAENVLRDSESRVRSLLELSSDWYWEHDAQGRFLRMDHHTKDRDLGYVGKRAPELGLQAEGGWDAYDALVARHEPFRDLVFTRQVKNETVYLSVSGGPSHDADGRFTGYRGVARDISERRRSEERIRYLAMHDGLTGLPNRTMFSQILAHAVESSRRYERRFALMFIDLDRFKNINDTLGHEAGDQLLREVSSRLKHTLRASDVVARLGGDEFVVLLQEAAEDAEVGAAADKLLAAMATPLNLCGQECRVTASIGVASFPHDGDDEATLMKHADIAMYMAKEAGKNGFALYSHAKRSQALEKLTLENHLRRALERNELSLAYQAKLDLRSEGISGVEALLRWNNPLLGAIAPAQFIPLAEETGLIVPIGKWVLRTACLQAMAWQRDGLPPVAVAVNLSQRQFVDGTLVADVAAVLAETGLPAPLLELEITESMVMHDTDRVIAQLNELRRLGIRIAIDDFGTGYSSLAQLRHFPVNTLKVDRSFIRELATSADDKAIIDAIIQMGKTLSLTVVAEGVETQEQLTLLRERACDQMQGYHFSKPLPPEQFASLLRQRGVRTDAA
jgi:diguanylate cyclase (GGDEF)-like protein/PAS domain S-box-containing protein